MQPQISNTFALSAQKPAVSVDHINNYYLLTATRTVPAVNDPGWVLVAPGGQIPVPVTATPYLWHKAVTILTDGTELDPYVEFGGSLGQNGIDYDLVPSHSTIIHKEDDSYDPTQVSCGLILRNADGTATQQGTVPAGYSVQVSIDNAAASSYTLGANIATANHTVISFILKYGSIVIERHDIRVFTEGSQGLQGRGIYSMDTRFKANATGTTPACASDSDWAGWSDLSAAGYSSENKYLFRCVRTVYLESDGTYSSPEFVIDGPTVWGHDAEDVYICDLTNESDIIPTDSESKTTGQIILSTTIRLYKGATPQTINKPTGNHLRIAGIAPSVSPSSATANSYTLTWTIPSGTTIGFEELGIEIDANSDFSAAFSLAKVKSGAAGVSPTVYQILPSAAQYNAARDGNNYVPSTISPTCGYVKKTGNTTTIVNEVSAAFDNLNLYFRRKSRSTGTWEDGLYYKYADKKTEKLVNLSVADFKEIEFVIANNVSGASVQANNIAGIIDTESIPIVADGQSITGPAGRGVKSIVSRFKTTTANTAPAVPASLDDWAGWSELDDVTYNATNKYLWRCTQIIYLLPDGTDDTPEYSIDGPSVWGHESVDPFTVDLSNESDVIPTDSAGKTTGQVVITTRLRLYEGATLKTISRPDPSTIQLAGITPSVSPGTATANYYDITWTIPTATVISADRYEVTFTPKTNYSIVFSVVRVKGGAKGDSPAIYQLKPSTDQFSIGRTDANGYIPATVQLKCGYVKTQGTDTTIVADSTSAFDGYQIYFRRKKRVDDSWDYSNNSFRKYTTANYNSYLKSIDVSLYKAVEFIICSNSSATISDPNENYANVIGLIDREVVPIVVDGRVGNTGPTGNGISSDQFYYCLTATQAPPSTENLDVEHGWYIKGSQGCPTYPTQMQSFLWECEYIQYTTNPNLNQKILRLSSFYNLAIRPQLLRNTAFDGDLSDVWGALTNGRVNPEAIGACAGYQCEPYEYNADWNHNTCNDYLTQVVYHQDPTKGRLLKPSTWYTLSFYTRLRRYLNVTSNAYGFSGQFQQIYLRKGSYRLVLNGHCSAAARAAAQPVSLRAYIFGPMGSGSGWNTNRISEIKTVYDSTKESDILTIGGDYWLISDHTVRITEEQYNALSEQQKALYECFDPEGVYQVGFYAFKAQGQGGDAGETVTVNWWYVKSESDDNRLDAYCYPGVGDTTEQMFVDGAVQSGRYDCQSNFYLADDEEHADSQGWTRHYLTFKTHSTFDIISGNSHWTPDDNRQILFRLFRTWVEIGKIKLEEGFLPTDWCEMEDESIIDCTHNPRGTWQSSAEHQSDLENATYYYCNGTRDVVQALAGAGTTLKKYWRLKHRTSAAGYYNSVQPYLDPEHWEEAVHFKFVVVDAMFAEEINSDKIIAQKVRVYNQQRTKGLIIDPGETYPFQMGPVGNPNFKIDIDGKLFSTGADITGKITATSGKIAGFTISGNNLTAGNNTELKFGSGSKMTLGSSPFISTFANLSYSKTVNINGGVNEYIPVSYPFTCKENARVTLEPASGDDLNFKNFFAANIFDISYYSKRVLTDNNNRYGFQYAMIGSGHVVMDGIVDGVCCDKITFSRDDVIELLRPPFHSNRILVNSTHLRNHIVLPDMLSLLTTLGVGFVKSDNPTLFTFKMEIVNIGNPVGLMGRNAFEISDERPYYVNVFPRLFRNGTERNWTVEDEYYRNNYYGFLLRSNSITSVLFVYDSSQSEANRFRAYLNEDHDTIYTPPSY